MTKTDFDAKLSGLDNEIAANKAKNKSIENESKKLKTFDSRYFRIKSHFEKDGSQNYLVFQTINRYFKANTKYIYRGNIKDYLTKLLNLLLHLIIVLLH